MNIGALHAERQHRVAKEANHVQVGDRAKHHIISVSSSSYESLDIKRWDSCAYIYKSTTYWVARVGLEPK